MEKVLEPEMIYAQGLSLECRPNCLRYSTKFLVCPARDDTDEARCKHHQRFGEATRGTNE